MAAFLDGGRIPRSKYPRATLDQFALEEDMLYLCKQKVDGTVLYLLVEPSELRREALSHVHVKESGHLGQHKTLLKSDQFFYWLNLRRDVTAFVREFIVCQQFKTGNTLQQQWQELPPVNQPLERVSIDLTELGSGALGHKYVLTVIDHFSLFCEPVSYGEHLCEGGAS